VGCSHLGDDLQFVHGDLLLTAACPGFRVRLAALRALPIDDDTGAGSIRAEDSVFQVKALLIGSGLAILFERDAAIHAESTSLRDHETTIRAWLAVEFFFTMRAFHIAISFSLMSSLEKE
jgi:hypothetical protein